MFLYYEYNAMPYFQRPSLREQAAERRHLIQKSRSLREYTQIFAKHRILKNYGYILPVRLIQAFYIST